MAEYGFAANFLKANKEIGTLVKKATAGGWEMDKFLDALKLTKWWKARSDAQKRFDVELYENVGQVTGSLTEKAAVIHRMLIQMGFSLARSKVLAIARMAVRNGMSDAELRDLVGLKYSHGGNAGMIGQTRGDVKKLAGDFGIKVSSANQDNIVRAVLRGVRTVEDYEAYFRDQAKAQFSGVAAQLDKGFTLRQILDPYLQLAAEETGANAATMDITDGMWNAAAQYVEKPGATARAMTMDEWTKKVRTDTRYGFDKSQNGQRAAAVLANQLMEAFGAKG
jgi:hypothetical protein